VYYEDDPAHELPAELFPPGTELTGIVKKCRIVQRGGDTFAIIPMCYPSVPEAAADWSGWNQHAKLLGPHCADSTHARFYGVALLGALYILKWVLRDLAASDDDLYRLHLPSAPGSQLSEGSYTLEHLGVMYPEIKLDHLCYLLADIEREGAVDGTRLKRRKATYHEASTRSDSELRADAMQLLQVIRYVLDERLLAEHVEGVRESPHPFGLTATEIFDLGNQLGWEGERVSCLFDILIDGANLVTHVQRLVDEHGVAHWARTFEPDGEIVSDLARRLTRQWGLPPGF